MSSNKGIQARHHVLMAIAAIFAAALAYGIQYSSIATALWAGGAILLLSCGVTFSSVGQRWSPFLLPLLGMAMVAVLIQAAMGRTETHFAAFAFLAVLLIFRDWRSIVIAAAVVALHHVGFGWLQALQWGPICFSGEPTAARVVEHALYVVIQSVLLVLMALRLATEQRTFNELESMVDRMGGTSGRVNFGNLPVPTTPHAHQLHQVLVHVARTLEVVKDTAQSIETASAEVATGNQDLSSRTEQTASNLQETAASM
ncbi:hypothetical protein IP84_17450, partial [beta proteobacterium AAP99]